MKRLITFSIIKVFFTVNSLFVLANTNPPAIRVELFNIANGLSQTAVQCLVYDSYGFIWVGTQDGLNRFDGYNFTMYRNHPLDSTTLANNYVNSLCEDRNGNLWIGTWNGLSFYNRSEEVFKSYYHNPRNENSLSGNRIFSVFEDRQGVIWVKTTESLDRYNPTTDSFIRYPHFSDPFSFSSEYNDFAIYEDSENRLWVGTKDGLMQFDRDLGLYKRYFHDPKVNNSLSNNRVKDIFEDSNRNLWVATSNGLNLFQPKTNGFIRFFNKPNDIVSLPDNVVNTIFQDRKGTLWVGTEQGFCSVDLDKGIFKPHALSVSGSLLHSTTITCFVEDDSDILWIGTLLGLVKWDRKPQKFKHYHQKPDGSNLFSGNYVSSLFENDKGLIWVGTWGTGLFLFDRENGSIIKYSENSRERRICNDYVHVIYEKSNKDILIGTRNGVQVFVPSNKSFENFFKKNYQDASRIFNDNRIYDIVEDQRGNLWFATRIGLHKYDGNNFESFYHDPNDSSSLSSNEIHTIALDDSCLWVGTFNGLNRINLNTFEIKRYMRFSNYSPGELISNDIVSLLLSSKGTLWVGTASGLHFYNREDNSFALYTETEGLPNNLIYSIKEDNSANIWVSTNWGLAVINPQTDNIITFGVSDGLQSYEFNVGASYKSKTGELFFGGVSGFNAFYPDSIKYNATVPKIVFTSFEIIGTTGRKFIPAQNQSEIVISEDFSLINIEFSALDYTQPEKNQYYYKMEGLEDDWIYLGNKRSATFSNLREGTYVFRVKGSNSDGIWNEEGVAVKIIVKVKLWKSKIAYAIYVVLFFMSLVIFLRARTKIFRRTTQLLKEQKRSMKEIELQKEELLIKNKNITDSINYAKRIQEALIPTEQHFKDVIPDSFILYMPKDIVSGDFYWLNETKNKIFVAVIDCTGHGVPGAFMSIIGIELLRNITSVMGINDAGEILNRLDKGVYDTFSKGVGDYMTNVKDGMDVSFCVIDKEQNTLQFAGAFSNLYLIRDGKLIEIKGDRYTVGVGGDTETPLFKSHFIPVEPDDMIYLFTDGYIDQFGGPEGKKYKFRRFRHLLLNIHKLSLEDQRKQLQDSILEWRGEQEQVDDILIIGIKTDLSCFF